MSFAQCLDEITRAMGRALSPEEENDLYEGLQSRLRERRRGSRAESLDEAVRAAADDYAQEMAAAATIEKRNAAINLKRRLEALDFVRSQFGDDPAQGVQALLVGSNRAAKGSRNSAAAHQNLLRRSYLGGFIADIEKRGPGLWKAFVRGDIDLEIARALEARDRGEGALRSVPREANEIAEVIAKWQDVARMDANKAGAWIKKTPGYITRQSHDMHRIRSAGYEAWKAEILPRLTPETFQGGQPDAFLRAAYQGLASGIHLKTEAITPNAFKGPRNIAKRLSAERVLHFRSAEDWFAYHQRFGDGRGLAQSVLAGLERNAHATGLMRVLGTNPESMFHQITDALLRGIDDPLAQSKFAAKVQGALINQLRTLDGTTNVPVDAMGARIGSNLRIIQRMAKLGASLLSQFSDIPFYGSEMRYQGRTMLSGMAESIGNIFAGRGSAEKRELAGMLGTFADTMSADVANKFSIADDDGPGMLTTLQQYFFRWNGMSWWSDSQRRGAIFAMSYQLAHHRARTWGTLNADLRRTLSLFAIGEPEWNVVRAAATKEADGRHYVVPESIEAVADEAMLPLLAGREATPSRLATLKREVADKVRAYLDDRASFAQLMPDQRTRAIMQRGTRPGTALGEFVRFIGELKSFPAASIQKAVGREVYGRGSKTLGEALHNGNGEMIGLANLIVWTTAFGYLSMVAKDLAKGKSPRDPTDPKTWAAAMAQGGGGGIYGDFLFGEVRNRYGGGLLTTLAGPTLASVQDLADLWGRVREGDDAASAAFRLMISNTPFLNIFYTKMVLDYFILWQVQEWMNPGAMRRLEKRVEKENAQHFLIRPSQTVR